jgi:hypothetical protein
VTGTEQLELKAHEKRRQEVLGDLDYWEPDVDIHDIDNVLADPDHLRSLGQPDVDDYSQEFKKLLTQPEGARGLIGGAKVLKDLGGAGKVYDWRHSNWTPANGGLQTIRAFVHHIPVVPNQAGIADFIVLRNVLVAQGLMVQCATDREGNVALFTPFNVLCYQARGGNFCTTGCESMHMTTSEGWSKAQLRALAWCVQLCEEKHDVPYSTASISGTSGLITVEKKGQTTHKRVADASKQFNRSDPGWELPDNDDYRYMQHCVRFWREHHTFKGA